MQISFKIFLNTGFVRAEDECPGHLRGHEEQTRGSCEKGLTDGSVLELTCTSS